MGNTTTTTITTTTTTDGYSVKKRDFLKRAKTGDILLWSGVGLFSNVVRCFGMEQRWSHIGMVVRSGSEDGNRLYLLESEIGDTVYDHYTQRYKNGVKMTNLKERLERTDSYSCVVWRRLHVPDRLKPSQEAALRQLIESVSETHYSSVPELARSVYRLNTQDRDGFFCVELVAYLMAGMGVLDSDYKTPNNYRLRDFTEEFEALYFTNGCYLGREYTITTYVCFLGRFRSLLSYDHGTGLVSSPLHCRLAVIQGQSR
jgi:hypothetical protein